MLQDFIFGLKLLFKQRAFTTAALLTLALACFDRSIVLNMLCNSAHPTNEQLVATLFICRDL